MENHINAFIYFLANFFNSLSVLLALLIQESQKNKKEKNIPVILDKNSMLQYVQMVKCLSCAKKYSFCRCFECQKLIFSEENKYILGISVVCQNCSKYSVNIVCTECKTKISFLDKIDDTTNREKIKCSKCLKEFQYFAKDSEMLDENEIYSKKLSAFSEIFQGEPIQFGESTIDENYQSIEKSLIGKELYEVFDDENKSKETAIKKLNNLCLICHWNKKESVFYPCGHRCTCYKCAVYYFYLNKKCPKCFKKIEAIVPKIYEQFNDSDIGDIGLEKECKL